MQPCPKPYCAYGTLSSVKVRFLIEQESMGERELICAAEEDTGHLPPAPRHFFSSLEMRS